MTGLYLLFEDGGRVSWAAAGQHPPLLLKRCGTIPHVDPSLVDVPLGIHVDEPVHYTTVTWEIEVGERLLLYTDGLYEAYNPLGEKFGRTGLEAYLRDARALALTELVQGLIERVEDHLEGGEFEDDFTIIGIERTG
jgi:sigma-B regulation protein RsbU (phosphoserine phosphatase)